MNTGHYDSENELENPVNIEVGSIYTMGTEKPKKVARTLSTEYSQYDSVHSIKMPLRTYGRKKVKSPYRRISREDGKCTVSELMLKTKGLEFDRVEKSIELPIEFSKPSCKLQRKNKNSKVLVHSRKT